MLKLPDDIVLPENLNYFKDTDQLYEQYIKFPKDLLCNPNYPKLTSHAKLIYMLLLERVALSVLNGWVYKDGIVYVIYQKQELANILELSYDTITKTFKELEKHQLIYQHKLKSGSPNVLFLAKLQSSKNVTSMDCPATSGTVSRNIMDTVLQHPGQYPVTSVTSNLNNKPLVNTINLNNKNISATAGNKNILNQTTLFNKPQTVPISNLSKYEQISVDHIAHARQTGDWSAVTFRDLTYYYAAQHLKILNVVISIDFRNDVGKIRDFINLYNIAIPDVCYYIDQLLEKYSKKADRSKVLLPGALKVESLTKIFIKSIRSTLEREQRDKQFELETEAYYKTLTPEQLDRALNEVY